MNVSTLSRRTGFAGITLALLAWSPQPRSDREDSLEIWWGEATIPSSHFYNTPIGFDYETREFAYLEIRGNEEQAGHYTFLLCRLVIDSGWQHDIQVPANFKDSGLYDLATHEFDTAYPPVILSSTDYNSLYNWADNQNANLEFFRIRKRAQPNLSAPAGEDTARRWDTAYEHWPNGSPSRGLWLPTGIDQSTQIVNLEALAKQLITRQTGIDGREFFYHWGLKAAEEYNMRIQFQAFTVWGDEFNSFPSDDVPVPPHPFRSNGGGGSGYLSAGTSSPLEYHFVPSWGGPGGKNYPLELEPVTHVWFVARGDELHFEATRVFKDSKAKLVVTPPGGGVYHTMVDLHLSDQGLQKVYIRLPLTIASGSQVKITEFETPTGKVLIPGEHQDTMYVQ